MRFFCSSFLDIFFFFCVAAKSPPFYTAIRILGLNHNHVICITSTHIHTDKRHTLYHAYCKHKMLRPYFSVQFDSRTLKIFRHLCTSVPTINGHGGSRVERRCWVNCQSRRPTNLDNSMGKGLLRL